MNSIPIPLVRRWSQRPAISTGEPAGEHPLSAGTPGNRVPSIHPRAARLPLVQRVLFVDDEPLIRRVFARSMQRHGLDVVAAASPLEALEMLDDGETFEVVVTDLSMPEMNGMTLITKIYERCPETRFVLLTGHYHLPKNGAYRLDEPAVHVVEKPWVDKELASLLHSLLPRSPSPVRAAG